MESKSQWKTLDLSAIPGEALTDAVEGLKSAVDAIEPILDIIVTGMNISSGVVTDSAEVYNKAVNAAVDLVDTALETFTGTSVSVTWFVPKSYRTAPSPTTAFSALANSYYDLSDPNRPIAKKDSTYFGTVVILVPGPDVSSVASSIDSLATLFGIPIPSSLPDQSYYFDEYGGQYPPKSTPGDGREPNWITKRFADLGAIGDLVTKIQSISDGLRPPKARSEFYRDQIELIDSRISSIIETVDSVIEQTIVVSEIAAATEGLPVYVSMGRGKKQKQVAQLAIATSLEDYPIDDGHVVGYVALHLQSATAGPIETLLSLMSVSDIEATKIDLLRYMQDSETASSLRSGTSDVTNPWDQE